MNRLDLTLRSTIHIQYANALAFDFFFFGSFFFTAVERKDTYRPLFSLRSKVFCMTSIRGQAPRYPQKTQTTLNQSNRRGEGGSVTCNTPSSLDWSFYKPVLRSFKGLIQDISNCKKKIKIYTKNKITIKIA